MLETEASNSLSSQEASSILLVHNIGIGNCKSELLLDRVFSKYGRFVAGIIHERQNEGGKDDSWALVRMASQAAAAAVLNQRVMALDGKTTLGVQLFSKWKGMENTGAVRQIGQSS